MRPAMAMIELIFAIVIIAISVVTIEIILLLTRGLWFLILIQVI